MTQSAGIHVLRRSGSDRDDGSDDDKKGSGTDPHDHKSNGSSFTSEEVLDTPGKSVPGERNIHTTITSTAKDSTGQ